jgi:hypothetical protein
MALTGMGDTANSSVAYSLRKWIMNEVLFAGRTGPWPVGSVFKRMVWLAASSVQLGGLVPWAMHEEWLGLEELDMPLEGLGGGFEGAKVAHITDVHRSPVVREAYLRRCIEAVNSLEPDFVVMTGDFISVGPKVYARWVGELLSELSPKVAKLAVLGNHDHGLWHPNGLGGSRGLADYLTDRLEAAGVDVLHNRCRRFSRDGAEVQFVGVEEFWTPRYDPDQAVEQADPAVPTIGLIHNPDGAPDLAYRGAQWILAGHTHGRPTRDNRIAEAVFPSVHKHFIVGPYELEGGSTLYVNRGLGHARRPYSDHRPEVTLFTLASRQPVEADPSELELAGV